MVTIEAKNHRLIIGATTATTCVRPEASEVDRLVCNADRARRLLHWSPTVDLSTGLTRTVDWIRSHAERYRPEEYAV